MSESGVQFFNDLTNTPQSLHQAPGKNRRSDRVRCISFPFVEYGQIFISGLSQCRKLKTSTSTPTSLCTKHLARRGVLAESGVCIPFPSIWFWSDIDIRTPSRPYSPSTGKGAKTKSKENLPKLVTGKVRATRNPFPQYVTAEADAGGFLEWKTKVASQKVFFF